MASGRERRETFKCMSWFTFKLLCASIILKIKINLVTIPRLDYERLWRRQLRKLSELFRQEIRTAKTRWCVDSRLIFIHGM